MLQFLPQPTSFLVWNVSEIFKVATFQNTFCSVPRIIIVLWDKADHKAWSESAVFEGENACDEGYWVDPESSWLGEALWSISIWLKYFYITRITGPNCTLSYHASRANTNSFRNSEKKMKLLPFKTMFMCLAGWVSAMWRKWSEILYRLVPSLKTKINVPSVIFQQDSESKLVVLCKMGVTVMGEWKL